MGISLFFLVIIIKADALNVNTIKTIEVCMYLMSTPHVQCQGFKQNHNPQIPLKPGTHEADFQQLKASGYSRTWFVSVGIVLADLTCLIGNDMLNMLYTIFDLMPIISCVKNVGTVYNKKIIFQHILCFM